MKSTPTRLLLLFFAALLATSLLAADPTPDELQSQLRYARSKLLELKKTYAEGHPSMVEQRAKIAALDDSRSDANDERMDAAVDAALARLATDNRALLEAKYFSGLPVRMIAENLSTTPKAVESRLTRARAELRRELKLLLSHHE